VTVPIEARGAGAVESSPTRPDVAVESPARTTIPRATYRVQFHGGFRLADAYDLVPYLAQLGVSHLYASPILKARPGSTHGYDIVDHAALNPEIGTREDLQRLSTRLREHGLGLVLDIVPNHMGIGTDNGWWMDVLENGQASERAEFFDVDWRPAKPELRGRVLLPVLGDHYGAVLDRGELVLELACADALAGLHVRYGEQRFPLDPATYPDVLGTDPAGLRAALVDEPDTLARIESLLTAFAKLPARDSIDEASRAERARDRTLHRQALAELLARSAALAAHAEHAVRTFGSAESRERLHALLERQAWRLAFWRTAADEINYRRFFDINDLAGLRQEQPNVFDETHRLIGDLVAVGIVDGLRIDHPDGLRDPAGYYEQLATRMAAVLGRDRARGLPIYVVAEKILQSYEHLPEGWAVHGTTGYDVAPLLTGWYTYAPAERAMLRTYSQFTGLHQELDDELYAAKKLVMGAALASELTVLANRLNRLSEADVHTRDYTLNALRSALAEVAACFPVYRTYVTPEGAAPDDRRYVDWAVAQARKRSTAVDLSVFDFVRRVLLLEGFADAPEPMRREAIGVAMRFQQFTAPLMAKGFEDTVLYRHHALVALNEVGGHPRRFHTSTAALHRGNADRARDWPHAMLTTSTHDTKRAEDVRMRLCVLSELADDWKSRVQRWAQLNHRRKRRPKADTAWPGPRIEYLLYQMLVGTWPVGEFDRAVHRERIHAYAEKATREAKTHTSWVNPNAEYETALRAFVDALLPETGGGPFLADFEPFARDVAWFGALASLSQQLLKLTAPGVPDVYQGTELIDLSMVDPDNRRPVDYAKRRRLLDDFEALGALDTAGAADEPAVAQAAGLLLEDPNDGRAKLWLTARTLRLRAARHALFRDGDYVPLEVRGERAEHVIAYLRRHGERAVLVVATRWHATLTERATRLPVGATVWGDTCIALPGEAHGAWRDVLSGTRVSVERSALPLAELLRAWPLALLADED
jgi:(1->4)-alpha-D-glucan 1-alpha-D-glucosylmutase